MGNKVSVYQRPYWLITISAIFILVVSQLIQDGMFNDGMLYVCVSKNLANGIGTFWHPYFGNTLKTPFHEQPPLYFGLLAVFFKVFGQSLYVERLFCLLTLVITGFYIHKIWKVLLGKDETNAGISWLPVLLWITVPVCFWSYTNLVEETVMSVFTTTSVYCIVKALIDKKQIMLNIILAGILAFFASLTKGFQGLFPIVAVGLFWIVYSSDISFKKCFMYSSVLTLIPLLIYAVLLTNPVIYSSYELYFKARLVPTFSGKMDSTHNRLKLAGFLFTHLLPALVFSVIILIIGKIKMKDVLARPLLKPALWLLLIGFSATLPLMVTYEQREFYLTTGMPFFSLALSLVISPSVSFFQDKLNITRKAISVFKYFTWILFFVSVIYAAMQIGKTKRDKDLLSDIYAINKIVPYGEAISTPSDLWNEWSVHCYFNRFNYVILEDVAARQYHYFVKNKSSALDSTISARYIKIPLNTNRLDLYQLK